MQPESIVGMRMSRTGSTTGGAACGQRVMRRPSGRQAGRQAGTRARRARMAHLRAPQAHRHARTGPRKGREHGRALTWARAQRRTVRGSQGIAAAIGPHRPARTGRRPGRGSRGSSSSSPTPSSNLAVEPPHPAHRRPLRAFCGNHAAPCTRAAPARCDARLCLPLITAPSPGSSLPCEPCLHFSNF